MNYGFSEDYTAVKESLPEWERGKRNANSVLGWRHLEISKANRANDLKGNKDTVTAVEEGGR